MAFLPKEKILIEADVYTPPATPAEGAPTTAAAGPVNPSTANLVDNVEKLKLDFETILPLHGPGAASRADLYTAIRKPMPPISQILSAQPPAAGGRGQRAAAAAPGSAPKPDGKQILETACTTCHTLARVSSLKLTKPEWVTMVDKMKGRGAELSEEDTSAVVEYLVKTYGLP